MPIKVLLADDDRTMVALLKTLLEMEGLSVYTHTFNGDDLTKSIENVKPDVLLLDVHLQTSNGLDILKQLRQEPAYNHLKIIMTSGLDFGDKCAQLGADGFLVKPYMPEELINLVKNQIKQN